MRVSAKTEYACIAMLELASQYGSDEPVRIRKIAERHSVPPRFLVQILLQLKGAGLVKSTRGAAGGYHLVRPPEEVSLGEVMQVVEGGTKHNGQTTNASPDSPAVKALSQAWKEVDAAERAMLNKITLAELVERTHGQEDTDVSHLTSPSPGIWPACCTRAGRCRVHLPEARGAGAPGEAVLDR